MESIQWCAVSSPNLPASTFAELKVLGRSIGVHRQEEELLESKFPTSNKHERNNYTRTSRNVSRKKRKYSRSFVAISLQISSNKIMQFRQTRFP